MQVVQLGGRQTADAIRESTTREFEIFSGDGANLVFTLTDTEAVPDFVEVGGLPQRPGIDYIVAANVVTFAVGNAPANLVNNVVVYYFTEINLTTDPLSRINVDTAPATILLNLGSKKQRNFLGSAPVGGAKNVRIINGSVGLKSYYAFEISALPALQTLTVDGSEFKSNDGGWNSVGKIWTPAAIGNYIIEMTMAGNYWEAIFHGPNT